VFALAVGGEHGVSRRSASIVDLSISGGELRQLFWDQ